MDLTSISLDQLWRAPSFPMWLTLIAAAFLALVLFVTLLRAERTVANGALTVITLLAVAVAAAATTRGFGPGSAANGNANAPMPTMASLPALSCMDDLAGDSVETACERILFGSPDTVAAAVSYAAAQISHLTAFGDVSAANRVLTPELQALRGAVERDRYGLIAHVLTTRDRCSVAMCAAFQSMTDHSRIVANMEEQAYNGRVTRYAASWESKAETGAALAAPPLAGILPSLPTGKPTNAEFPSSASIPPVNIMTPEPPPNTASTPPSSAAAPAARPAAAAKSQTAAQPPAAAKKKTSAAPKAAPVQSSPQPPVPPPPVQLAPAGAR